LPLGGWIARELRNTYAERSCCRRAVPADASGATENRVGAGAAFGTRHFPWRGTDAPAGSWSQRQSRLARMGERHTGHRDAPAAEKEAANPELHPGFRVFALPTAKSDRRVRHGTGPLLEFPG